MKIAYVNRPWDPAVPPVKSGSIAILTYQVARRLAKFQDILVYAPKSMREKKAYNQKDDGEVRYPAYQ